MDLLTNTQYSSSLPASNFDDRHSSSAGSSRKSYSTQRITTYLVDPHSSQVLHLHSSTEQSIQVHTAAMQATFDNLDSRISENKKKFFFEKTVGKEKAK
jgi:hypothetical protein